MVTGYLDYCVFFKFWGWKVLGLEGDKYVVPLEKSLVNKFLTLSSMSEAHIYVDKMCCCIF